MATETATQSSDLATILVPVSHDNYLLLPGITVAEVIHYDAPQALEGKPEWFLGLLDWRTKQIPLVSYEMMNGQPCDHGPNVHIAVLNGSENPDSMPFYAILTQATPRLLRLAAQEISENADAQPGPVDAMLARANGEPVVIPDVVKIEKQIAAALG